MIEKLLIVLVSLCVPLCLFSQNQLVLRGEILDKNTGQGIPYVQIKIKNSSIGVITNFEGEFRLNIPNQFQEDTLQVSSIGYNDRKILIQELLNEDFVSLRLANRIYSIEEIAIQDKKKKELTGSDIVRKAINRIKQNYPREEQVLSGYYRDYLWKDDTYFNLMEAAIKVYDPGFAKYDYKHTQTVLEQFRFSNAYEVDTSFANSYASGEKVIPEMQMGYRGGNEFSILRLHDPIRNYRRPSFAFIYVFQRDFRLFHEFQVDSVLIQDKDILYEISFSLKESPVFSHIVRGKIFIRASDFAILKLSYANLFRPEDPEEGIRYEILLEYQEYEEKMYLKYVSMNNYLLARKPGPIFQVEKVAVTNNKKRVNVTFSMPLEIESSENIENYTLSIKGNSYKIESIHHLDMNKVELVLQKPITTKSVEEMRLEVHNIKSAYGNLVNTIPMESMYQYREFFVNKIELPNDEPVDVQSFMDKERSIYTHSVAEKPGFWENYNYVLNQALRKNR